MNRRLVCCYENTNLIVEVSERKSDGLSFWNACHTEVEPSLVEIAVAEVGLAVCAHPQVNMVFILATLSLS